MEELGVIPWSSNYAFLVTINKDGNEVHAIYKPRRGERPLWDFPVGTLFKRPGFGLLYKWIFKPLGLVKPDVLLDNPEPHRFAQGFGGVVMLGASVALLTGATTLGWSLAWLVVALAALNLFGGFCVGCAVYYWLNRLNVPGFAKSPPADTFPGARPKVKANQP